MRVSGFMKPADQIITINVTDTIRCALELLMEHQIGSLVVLASDTSSSSPLGIITQTDLLRQGYHQALNPDQHTVAELMTNPTKFLTCLDTQNTGQVARLLERSKVHHVIVVDSKTHAFAGLVSAWDIAVECARDDHSWPWIRSEDGRVHDTKEENDDDVWLLPSPQYDPDTLVGRRHVHHSKSTNNGRHQHHHAPHPFSRAFQYYLDHKI